MELTDKNRLSIVKPELCKEWDVKNEFPPSTYAAGSGKKAWWKCGVCENVWSAQIKSRRDGRGCPRCSRGIHVSKFEMRVYTEIKQHFSDAIHGSKINGVEVDVLIPSKAIGIEIDGHHWHQNIEKDKKKNARLLKMGMTLIRVREDLPLISTLDVVYHRNDDKDVVLKRLLKTLGSDESLRGENEYRKMMVDFRRVHPDKVLSKTHPDLCLEWSKRNAPLMPNHVSMGSMDMVWWTCPKGHEWQSRVDARVRGNGCPECAGRTGLKVSDTNLVEDWDIGNVESPEKVSTSSTRSFWWHCKKHDCRYAKTPHDRYFYKKGCPICNGYKPSFGDSIASCESIMMAWDYDRNENLKPEDLKKGSVKKIWLKTKNGTSSSFVVREAVNRKSEF